jgi:hypothetical protein
MAGAGRRGHVRSPPSVPRGRTSRIIRSGQRVPPGAPGPRVRHPHRHVGSAQSTACRPEQSRLEETAAQRLQALGQVPPADPAFLQANGAKVQQAGAELQSVSQVPPDDLAYLSANGADVAQAAEDNAEQWQTWWWICLPGRLVFLPFVFVMTGRWSPRRAPPARGGRRGRFAYGPGAS